MKKIFLSLLIYMFPLISNALYTELGFNFAYKKSFIDSLDITEQQGITGSMSLYFWERLALELSYTNSLYVKKERNSSSVSSSSQRVTTQYADIYETNLMWVFADRKAPFQPYVKGGAGYVTKRQVSQIDNDPSWTVGPYVGLAPSYGAGLKFFITEDIAIRMSYDVVQTPIDNNYSANDLSGRLGLSWIF